MKTAVLLILAIVAQAAGDTCLSRAMKLVAARVPSGAGLSVALFVQGLKSPLLWIGVLLLLVFLALFLTLLSWKDLSFVLPAMSFFYVLNVAFARVFLGESVSAVRWAGTLLIALGVVLVSRSEHGGGRTLPTEGAAVLESEDPA